MIDRDKSIKSLLDYQELVKLQTRKISDLAYALYTEQDESVQALTKTFAIDNEEIYLKLKRLVYDMQDRQIGNTHEMIGTTDFFDASLTELKPGLWKFHLPPFFSIQSSDRGPSNAGKHMFYLVLNLEADYERENGKIQKVEEPLIVFEHHICSSFQKVFDFDNIDSKRALDALQGTFIRDDNALSLITVNMAVKDSDESYCDLYIADRKEPFIYELIAARSSDNDVKIAKNQSKK